MGKAANQWKNWFVPVLMTDSLLFCTTFLYWKKFDFYTLHANNVCKSTMLLYFIWPQDAQERAQLQLWFMKRTKYTNILYSYHYTLYRDNADKRSVSVILYMRIKYTRLQWQLYLIKGFGKIGLITSQGNLKKILTVLGVVLLKRDQLFFYFIHYIWPSGNYQKAVA